MHNTFEKPKTERNTNKRNFIFAGVLVLFLFLTFWISAHAASIFIVQQGGTGQGSFTSGNLLYGAGTNALQSVSTTTASCSGSASCTSFTVIGSSPVTISASGGSPGGLNTQVQYNNAGVFGGVSGATTNGTILSLTNALLGGATLTTSSVNGVTLTTGGSSTAFLNGAGSYTTPTGGGAGLSTSSPISAGNILEYSSTGAGSAFGVATTTASCSGTVSCTGFNILGSSPITITGSGSSLTGTTGQVAYFSGTNTAVGTSSLFIATSGNVGIANASPAYPLDILKSNNTGNDNPLINLSTNSTIGTGINIANTSTGGKAFEFFSTGSANTPGHFGVYDITDNQSGLDITGSTGTLGVISTAVIGWSSTGLAYTQDTGLSRISAGKIGVGNGSASNASGTLVAGNITVGTLNGLIKGTTGVLGVATAGTDYLAPTGSGSGLTGIPTTVSNADGTLTISPTTGAVVASLALGHANTWTGQQTFNTSAPIFGTMTAGSVLFAGTSGVLSQDNANLFYNATNHTLGLGTTTQPTNYLLDLTSASKQQVVFSDGTLTSDQWAVRNSGGTLYFGTSSPSTYSTSTPSGISIASAASTQLGVGTTSPWRTLSVTGTVGMDGLTTSTGTVVGVCLNTTTKELTANTVASCLVSSRAFKHDIEALTIDATSTIMQFEPSSYVYNGSTQMRYGLIAEDVASVSPALGGYDASGKVTSYDDVGVVAIIIQALKTIIPHESVQDQEIAALQAQVAALQATHEYMCHI